MKFSCYLFYRLLLILVILIVMIMLVMGISDGVSSNFHRNKFLLNAYKYF